MTQNISQVFSYTFVFLFGVLVGAIGELIWHGIFRKKDNPANDSTYYSNEVGVEETTDLSSIQTQVNENQPESDGGSDSNHPGTDGITGQKTHQPMRTKKVIELKPTRPVSIIDQVDEILQDLQKFSKSSLETIKIFDDGHQGVLVKIGTQTFAGIDAVPDQDAQSLIRKAVAEWERRHPQ